MGSCVSVCVKLAGNFLTGEELGRWLLSAPIRLVLAKESEVSGVK